MWYDLEHERSLGYYHLAMQYLPSRKAHKDLYNKVLIGFINNFNNIPLPDSATVYLDKYYAVNQHDADALTEYHRLYGICHYLTDEYTESISHLKLATALIKTQRDPNPFSSIDAFHVLSAAYQSAGKFTDALESIDNALMRRFGNTNNLKLFQRDISSVGLFASRAEILADSAMAMKDTSIALEALDMYASLDTLRRHFIKLDIDTYLHQQFYDNYTYWKPMEIYAFLYQQTGSEKWLHDVHDLITSYKAQGFNRDKILNHLFRSSLRNETSFSQFVRNDIALEQAIRRGSVIEINELLRDRQGIIRVLSTEIPTVIDELIHPKNISSSDLLEFTIGNRKAVINYYIGNTYYNENTIYILIAVDGKFKFLINDHSADILRLTDRLYQMHKIAAGTPSTFDTFEYYLTSYQLYTELFKSTISYLEEVKELVIISYTHCLSIALSLLTSHNTRSPVGVPWTALFI
jgi:hypothetical protein